MADSVLHKLVEGQLERECRNVGWLVSKQIGGGDNQWHVLKGEEHLTVGGDKDVRHKGARPREQVRCDGTGNGGE